MNQNLGGKKGGLYVCALRTGSFNPGTSLSVDIGSSGKIYGGGGDGGKGVVILRYPNSATLSKTGTLTESTGSPFTEGSDKISVFTSGDGTISFADASISL